MIIIINFRVWGQETSLNNLEFLTITIALSSYKISILEPKISKKKVLCLQICRTNAYLDLVDLLLLLSELQFRMYLFKTLNIQGPNDLGHKELHELKCFPGLQLTSTNLLFLDLNLGSGGYLTV